MQRSTTVTQRECVNRKLVIVGDEQTGKTSLLYVFARDNFPDTYIPTILETEIMEVTLPVKTGRAVTVVPPPPPVELTIWDTAGQEDFDRLRPLVYDKTDIFVICYSVDNISSYMNVLEKWVPEIRQFCIRTSILLVATKTDLRYDDLTQRKMARKGRSLITTIQGLTLAHKVQARAYLECSCEDKDSIFDVFQTAATVALYVPRMDKKTKSCTIL